MSQRRSILVCTLLAALATGCDREPEFVYVLEAPQTVELFASASVTTVLAGKPVVLHAQRRTSGLWKRIRMKERAPDQCWVQRPPPQSEPEVADNLHWTVVPEGSARFNIDYRSDRTRLVTLPHAGQFTLTPTTAVWCEQGRSVAAPPIHIEVTAK